MNQNYNQFFFTNKDVLDHDELGELQTETLVTILCLTEREHPGVLPYIFRQVALAMNGWKITSKSSNPEASLRAQKSLLAIALQFQKECEGGNNHSSRRYQ